MFLRRCLGVQALKTSRRPSRLAKESEKVRERGRRYVKLDGNRLPQVLLPLSSPTLLEGTHLPSINLVTIVVEGSGGSG
jgi:hypothetical protein